MEVDSTALLLPSVASRRVATLRHATSCFCYVLYVLLLCSPSLSSTYITLLLIAKPRVQFSPAKMTTVLMMSPVDYDIVCFTSNGYFVLLLYLKPSSFPLIFTSYILDAFLTYTFNTISLFFIHP